jgi:ubiquinol-cytochrome c reductase cytochrome b subunit
MGWLDGALRVMPSWEIHLPGHMIPNAFFPGILLPGITFNLIYAWPILEAKWKKDFSEHHILDRPRDQPMRTAIGSSVFAFYFVLFGASATDVLANYLSLSLNFVLWAFRILCIVVPIIVFPVAYKICLELQGTPGGGKRKRHHIVSRRPDGGYVVDESPDYVGYMEPELPPVDVDEVDLVSAMNYVPIDPSPTLRETATDGIYRVPRDYRK